MADKKQAKKPRAPRQTVDRSNETKAQKFSRLGSARMGKALKAIKNIGNLSGAGYERTPEQVKKIGADLSAAVAAVLARFNTVQEKKAAAEAYTL